MLIRLLAGGCGYEEKQADGSIMRSLKTPADGPFDCPYEMALSMIKTGQAQPLEPVSKAADNAADSERCIDLSHMTLKELKKLADQKGLAYSSKTTKAGLIEALEDNYV